MALTYQLKARARREIEQAAAWWFANRLSAPGAIRLDVQDALAILIEYPDIGTIIENARGRQVRRFYLNRSGYFLYYRVKSEVLEVLSFWHSSREHGPRL